MAHVIGISGTGPTLEYELSAGEHLQPQTITTAVDGSAAAADFVVQVTIRNQQGDILSRTRTDDVVTSGDSGEATFAPFVRASGGASPFLGLPTATFSMGAPLVATSGVARSDFWDASSFTGAFLPSPGFGQRSAAPFIVPTLVSDGMYLLTMHVKWAAAFAGARYIEMAVAGVPSSPWRQSGSATPDDDEMELSVLVHGPGAASVDWTATVFQNSGVNRSFDAFVSGAYYGGQD